MSWDFLFLVNEQSERLMFWDVFLGKCARFIAGFKSMQIFFLILLACFFSLKSTDIYKFGSKESMELKLAFYTLV